MDKIIEKIKEVWQERDSLKFQLLNMQENYAKINQELKINKDESDHYRALWYDEKNKVENMKGMIAGYNMQITSMEKEMEKIREEYNHLKDAKGDSLIAAAYIRHHDIRSRDKEIDRLKSELNKIIIDNKNTKPSIDKNEIREDSQREVIENLIAYAEKLPKHRCLEATAIQGAISLLVTRRKISNNVINDELGKRLENIGVEDNKATTTNINTGGGPVIMGGQFDNTDFVAQKQLNQDE